jgi:hypothetical protein
MPSASSAVTIGSPIATTEPNATSRTITATVIPINSDLPNPAWRSIRSIGEPPTSTWKPGVELSFRSDASALMLDRFRSRAFAVCCTLMRAIVPSAEIAPCCAYGDDTSFTCGSAWSLAMSSSTRVRVCASLRLPPGTCTTTVEASPAACGKRSSSRL